MNRQNQNQSKTSISSTRGIVITWAWRYDLLLWVGNLVSRGKLQALRHRTADLARLQPGEAVLDVGCGTGTQALIAKERVGATGHVDAIDPSQPMLARARRKAKHAKRAIDFQLGVIEHLPFPNQSFDAVLITMVMHQLPDDLKRQGLAEIVRVLKPGGRVLVVDTGNPKEHQSRPSSPVRTLHWESSLQEQPTLLQEAGFSQIESGNTGFHFRGFEISFVRAQKS